MRVQVSSVAAKGALENERIVLKVLLDGDIGNFLLLQTGFHGKSVTVQVFHAYWFPWKKVSAGDLVVVYTKAGTSSEKAIDGGHTAHFFYWDLTQAIWNMKNRAAVLLHAPEWDSKTPDEL